ncbi:MAG: very short patch repair endonuclease [Verrucomicrobiales bacterium]|jgi:DNA mismatch endonuclease (patch repair protein)|nr:very short patch repair endonuclease [Verrucomicrobiales bacterium]
MTDIFTKAKRSQVMSSIRGKGNKKTELRLIEIFKNHRIKGWRRNSKLFGRPDFVFPNEKLAVFVDGCYWHGCPKHYRLPTTHIKYWSAKITRNRKRDREVGSALRKAGWRVLRIWEHALTRKQEVCTVRRILKALE